MAAFSEDDLAVVARLILQSDPLEDARAGESSATNAARGATGATGAWRATGEAQARAQAKGYESGYAKLRSTILDAQKVAAKEQLALLKANARAQGVVLEAATRQAGERASVAAKEAASRRLIVEREGANSRNIAQRGANTIAYTELQGELRRENDTLRASHERRTALFKAFLRANQSILSAGLGAARHTWESYLEGRRNREKASFSEEASIARGGLERQTSVIRTQLESQNSTYTRAARERLATIERTQAAQTRVITESAVKQAEAQQRIQARTSGGVIGAATGRSSAGGGLQNLLALAGGGLVIRQIQQETIQAVKANALTAAGIASTGGAAGVTSKQVQDLARRLSVLAGIDDQVVQGGENILLTFRGIQNTKINKTFDQATLAALDLSVRFHKDLTSSAILVGKALQDPIKGLGALRRVGVQFTQQQQDQIKVLVGSGHLLQAQKMILRELSIEVGGSAAAAATAGDKFKVVIKNIEQTIGLAFYGPVTKALTFVGDILSKLFYGSGTWKVLRDGLEGVAIGLGAILTVKAGVEVVGLLGDAFAVLAASPTAVALTALTALSGVTFALLRNSTAVKGFFDGLVRGTVGWAKVGYLIDKPIKNLSFIVFLQSSIGSAARHIKDFFVSLEVGTRNWAKVGFLVDHPIQGLSKIVLLQSTLGAAARNIYNHLGILKMAFSDLGKFKFKQAGSLLSDFLHSFLGTLGPAETVIHKGIKSLFGKIEGFLASAILPKIALGRLNIGSFLLSALGIPVSGGGAVQSFIRDHIIKTITGSLNIGDIARNLIPKPGQLNADRVLGGFAASLQASRSATGTKLGKAFHNIIVKGLEAAAAIGVDIGGFVSSLFTGKAGGKSGAAGHALGLRLHGLIATAFSEVGRLGAPLGSLLGKAGSAIGGFFEKIILPGLIEIPYKIGKFLSHTVFSKAFLNTVINGVAGFAAIAATMAVQFILGFVKGLEQRKGDIAKVLLRVLKFAVSTVFGSGNPFLLLGGLFVAAFAGVKIKGAFDTLRGYSRVATAGIKGDFTGAQQASRNMRDEITKIHGPGAAIGNAALSLRRGFEGAATAASAVSTAVGNIPYHIIDAGRGIKNLGRDILNLTDTQLTASGRYRDTSALGGGRFIPDPTADLSRLRLAVGKAFVVVGQTVTAFGDKAAGVFAGVRQAATNAWSGIKSGASTAFQYVKNNARSILQGGMAAVFTGLSSYAATSSGDIKTRMVGILGTVAEVAGAFAVGGPIVGSIAAVGGIIGAVFGDADRKSRRSKAIAAQAAADVKAINESLTVSLATALKAQGGTGSADLQRAAFAAFQDQIGKPGFKDAVSRFKVNAEDLARAAGGGKRALDEFGRAAISNEVSRIIKGNATAVHDFSTQLGEAASKGASLADSFANINTGGESSARGFTALIYDASRKLADGSINLDTFATKLRHLGLTSDQVRQVTDKFKSSLTGLVKADPGATFLSGFGSAIQKAIDQQDQFNVLQTAADRIAEKSKGFAAQFEGAYGRIKATIDSATQSVQDFFTASAGPSADQATARLSLADLAKQGNDAHQNLKGGALTDTLSGIYDQARQTIAPIIAQIVSTSGTPGLAKLRLDTFFLSFEKNYPDFKAFAETLRKNIPPGTLAAALTGEKVKDVNDLAGRFADFLKDPKNVKIKTQLDNADPKDRIAILKRDLQDFANQDPTVHMYLSSGPQGKKHLDEAIQNIKDTIGTPFHDRDMNVTVKLQFDQKSKLLAIKLGLLDATHGASTPGIGSNSTDAVPHLTPPPPSNAVPFPQGTTTGAGPKQGARSLFGATASTFGKQANQQPPIINNLDLTQHIHETTNPRLTAAETLRGIRNAEFLGGGTLSVAAYGSGGGAA